MTDSEKEEILRATEEDESLQELIKLIRKGFPKMSTQTSITIQCIDLKDK